VREIALTQGQVSLVDDEDFERLSQHKWCAAWYDAGCYGGRWYAVSRDPVLKTTLLMHRFIMGVTERTTLVDHWNQDGLDIYCRLLLIHLLYQRSCRSLYTDLQRLVGIFISEHAPCFTDYQMDQRTDERTGRKASPINHPSSASQPRSAEKQSSSGAEASRTTTEYKTRDHSELHP
jgi:hypothetical protein